MFAHWKLGICASDDYTGIPEVALGIAHADRDAAKRASTHRSRIAALTSVISVRFLHHSAWQHQINSSTGGEHSLTDGTELENL
jgi:hypothetical protein